MTKDKFKVSSSYEKLLQRCILDLKILDKKMKQLRSFFFFIISVLALSFFGCRATHSGNRYFFFLEHPSSYVTKHKSFMAPEFFYAKTSTAFRRYGGRSGIPELWGKYDLKDVITSLKTVYGESIDPIYQITGTHELDEKSLKFNIDGNLETAGLMLEYEQNLKALKLNDFTIGLWIPVYNINTTSKFSFNSNAYYKEYNKNLSRSEIVTIDQIRQLTHKEINIAGTDLNRGGFGDMDLHLRWNHYTEYALKMRSIDTNIQLGVVIPTGEKMNINYPATTPFMNNGHWGLYLDVVPEFELKQDWKIGFIIGILDLFKSRRITRLAVGKEPTTYSALVGKIEEDPGLTLKFSAYFTLENLTDGLNLQLRYTYLRHEMDKWFDKRSDQTIRSYLENRNSSAGLSANEAQKNFDEKCELSKWHSNYFTFELMYNTKEGLKNWLMQPQFFASYDLPINGNGFCKTHQFTLGAQLYF